MYKFGIGVSPDNHESLRWFRIIAEKEITKVSKRLIKIKGKNVPETLKIITNNAENGDIEAQFNLGVMSQLGILLPKDVKKAATLYKRLLVDRDKKIKKVGSSIRVTTPGPNPTNDFRANIPLLIGLLYDNEEEVLHDKEEALKWYLLGDDTNVLDNSKAVSIHELARENISQALKILISDAENGDINAQRNLVKILRLGIVVSKGIYINIDKWYYQIAAEQGNAKAETILALMHTNGQGVFPDDGESLKWLRLAEEQRRASEKTRIYKLAKYRISSALKILTDDAESGISEAQYYLGMIHTQGFGDSLDYVLGYMWFSLSELKGHEGATDKISSLEKKMSSQQIEQAQEMIKNWPKPIYK
jgi:TPR repeat protein